MTLRNLFLSIFLLISTTVFAVNGPVIWQGNYAKVLPNGGITFRSGNQLADLGSIDPTAGAGVVAPIGSIGVSTTGLWSKTGAGNTAWTLNASGSVMTSLTGDVTGTGPGATATTVAKIQSTTVSGTTGSGNVAFSASPTFTGTVTTDKLLTGNPGTEGASLLYQGGVYDAQFKVSDISDATPAEVLIHKHSTTMPSVLGMLRSKSTGTGHGAVSSGDVLAQIIGAGWGGNTIGYSAGTVLESVVGTGTVSDTSMPGRLNIYTVPNGSTTPALAVNINADKSTNLAGALNITGLTTMDQFNNVHSGGTGNSYFDGYGGAHIINGRRAGGTSGSPTAALADQNEVNISGSGYHTAGTPGFSLNGSVAIASAETQTDVAKGTYVAVNTTPVGSTTIGEMFRVSGTGITTPGTLGVTGLTTATGGVRADAGLAVGTTISNLRAVKLVQANTDTNTVYGIDHTNTPTVTTGAAINSRGISTVMHPIINTGITDSGAISGVNIENLRNYTTSGDTGTLTTQEGMKVSYGHFNSDASTPATTGAYGLHIIPYNGPGTQSTQSDIWLDALGLNTGTTTAGWGILQTNTKNNAFAGNVRIGSTVAPTQALDVTGNALVSGTLGVTGIATITDQLAVNGSISTLSSTGSPQFVIRSTSSGAPSLLLKFTDIDSSYAYPNWFMGPNGFTNGLFEITPSTAAHGNTFTTPALQISGAGLVTIPGTLAVTGTSAHTGSAGFGQAANTTYQVNIAKSITPLVTTTGSGQLYLENLNASATDAAAIIMTANGARRVQLSAFDNGSNAGTFSVSTRNASTGFVEQLKVDSAGAVTMPGSLNFQSLAVSNTAPTIASGFCSTGSPVTVVTYNNGTAAFLITIGAATCGNTGVVTLPAAAHGWHCTAVDNTGNDLVKQTTYSATSVTIGHFSALTGAATNFQAGELMTVGCVGF